MYLGISMIVSLTLLGIISKVFIKFSRVAFAIFIVLLKYNNYNFFFSNNTFGIYFHKQFDRNTRVYGMEK